MKKLALLFLLAFSLPASAQWGSGGLFRFYVSGTAAPLTDSARVIAGTGMVITKSANQITFSSTATAPAGSVDSTSIVNVSVAATDIVNGAILYAKLGTGVVDSVKAKDGGLIQADLRVSTLDSSRIAPGGIAQSDIRVSALDSSRIAPSGLTQADVRVSAFDSSRIAPSSLTTDDYRNSSVSAAKILKSDAFSWSGAHTHTAFQTAPDMLEFLGGALQATPTTGASDTTANYMPMKAFSVGDTATFDIFLSKRFASLDSIVVYAYSNTATSAVVFNCGVRQSAVGDAIAGAFNAAATKTISTGTAGTLRQWSMTSFGSLTASTPSMLRGKIYRTAGGTGGDIFVNRVLIYGVGLR